MEFILIITAFLLGMFYGRRSSYIKFGQEINKRTQALEVLNTMLAVEIEEAKKHESQTEQLL